MLRRICYIFLILSVCTNLAFTQKKDPAMKPTFHIKGNGVGYILLNGVIVTFEGLNPKKPDEWRKKVHISLNRLNKEADLARIQNKIDEPFFTRYRRILLVLKLVMLKGKDDKDTILNSYIVQEVNKFDIKTKMKEHELVMGIGSVAGAVAEELLSLKKYLDQQKEYKEKK